MDTQQSEKYERAKTRVEKIKGFYIHLAVYIVVNTFILINIYLQSDDFWRWEHFFTVFFWGLGVFFHAAKTFGFNLLFGEKWEERQIQKYIDKDKREAQKYN